MLWSRGHSDDSQQIVYWRLLSLDQAEQASEQVPVLSAGWIAPAAKDNLNEAQTQDAHSDAHEGQAVEQITPMAVSVFLSMSKPQAQTTDQVELNAEAF